MLRYSCKWMAISVVLSIILGLISSVFLNSLAWVTGFRESNLWIVALLPLAGFFISWCYDKYGGRASGGNNLLIDTINRGGERLPWHMAPFVYLGTILTHLFGGSAGREGTALQMSASIADQLTSPFKLSEQERRILLVASVAGGFGAVFGTPLAGVVFALEFSRIGKVNYSAILPALLTAVLSDLFGQLFLASHTHYHIDFVPELSFLGILYAVIAGVFFGIFAASFSLLMHKLSGLWKSLIAWVPLRSFAGGAVIALAVFLLGSSKYIGLGVPTIVSAFDTQLPFYDFALKIIFTAVTLSAGFKGGEVTPLFFIGATLGNALSLFIPLPMGLLAGMGFVAVFSGATNTPIACTLMAIELFGADCAVYVAVACVVAYLFSGNTSIYTAQTIGIAKNPLKVQQQQKSIKDFMG